jgi:hypothetical protein
MQAHQLSDVLREVKAQLRVKAHWLDFGSRQYPNNFVVSFKQEVLHASEQQSRGSLLPHTLFLRSTAFEFGPNGPIRKHSLHSYGWALADQKTPELLEEIFKTCAWCFPLSVGNRLGQGTPCTTCPHQLHCLSLKP